MLHAVGGGDFQIQLEVARFGIGLAPDSRNALKRALCSLGEERLVETGMLIKPDEGETYDRFRGRLMIPIRDQRGRVIAFGGRILGEGEPKYLNSPDTPLFDKGRTLYALDKARAGVAGGAGRPAASKVPSSTRPAMWQSLRSVASVLSLARPPGWRMTSSRMA